MKLEQQKYRRPLCPELTVSPIVHGSDGAIDEGACAETGIQFHRIFDFTEVLIRLRLVSHRL